MRKRLQLVSRMYAGRKRCGRKYLRRYDLQLEGEVNSSISIIVITDKGSLTFQVVLKTIDTRVTIHRTTIGTRSIACHCFNARLSGQG